MNTRLDPVRDTGGANSHEVELVEPEWLAEHLYDPDLRVVEVDVSPAAHDEWHIDGAVLWNVYGDLKDAAYRLVNVSLLEQLIARSGIAPDSTVVFYGYAPAVGFWLMKLYGHAHVHVLNCSRNTWRAEGHPRTDTPTERAVAEYHLGREDHRIRVDRGSVESAIGEPGRTLVDVRSTAEYRGERFWPSGGMDPDGRAGHVPSAVHQPIDGLYDERGAYRSVAELRSVFSSVDVDDQDELITYCTIGARAATAWFVLTYLLGRDHVRVYDGSWAEWGRMPDAPVEQS